MNEGINLQEMVQDVLYTLFEKAIAILGGKAIFSGVIEKAMAWVTRPG